MRTLFSIIALSVIAFAAGSALAQVVPPRIPSTVQPGNVEQRFKPVEAPNVSQEPLIIDESQKPKQGDTGQDVVFELKSIKVEGVAKYKESNLADTYSGYIGKKVSLATLQELAAKMTARLRNDGYVLSRAIVPSQKVEGGRVVIKIIGGEVHDVLIEGDIKGDPALVKAYADKIKVERPLNMKTLERYLLLTQDLPGVTAKAILRPSSVPGASDLVIQISHKYVDGSVGVDNRGGRYLGPWQSNAVVNVNSALGLYDKTTLRGDITADPRELQYVEVDHEEQIGTEGTKLILSGVYTNTNPGAGLRKFDITGQSKSLGIEITHPFIRSRAENLYGDIGFTYRDIHSDSPIIPSYNDDIREVKVGGSYDFIDFLEGVNRADLHYTQGIDVNVSNDAHSRANIDQDFSKFNLEVSHLQTIYGPFSAEARVAGQFSANTLFASEQFGLGGLPIGSAYDPFEIAGDSGLGGRGELQFNDKTEIRYFPSYQLYGFYEAGRVWNNNVIPGEFNDASLTDAGIGTRFNIMTQLSGGLELACPIGRNVQARGDTDPRVFFNLAYIF